MARAERSGAGRSAAIAANPEKKTPFNKSAAWTEGFQQGYDEGRQRKAARNLDRRVEKSIRGGNVIRDESAAISIYTRIGGDFMDTDTLSASTAIVQRNVWGSLRLGFTYYDYDQVLP